jgi:hypothetical protein
MSTYHQRHAPAKADRVTYVEGYAQAILPVHHAWNVDAQGRVMEVTWEEPGVAYFGIEFNPMLVTKGAVLFNFRDKIYQKPLEAQTKLRFPDGSRLNSRTVILVIFPFFCTHQKLYPQRYPCYYVLCYLSID